MASPTCNKCGALKVGSYLKESQCGKCRGESRKKLRIKRRKEKDLPEYGSGRDPKCKKCRTLKEIPYLNGSLCRKCKLERAKIDYEKKAREAGVPARIVGRSPICGKCGLPKENKKESQCNSCTNDRRKKLYALRKNDPEFMRILREKTIKRFQENELERLKKNCREATHRLINKGILKWMPCEVCGASEKVEAHHDDYYDPMNVRWLCKKHHEVHHHSPT